MMMKQIAVVGETRVGFSGNRLKPFHKNQI